MAKQVVAETLHGRIGGLIADGIAVFKGVPFAAPPVDKLRFEPPQPPIAWGGIRDATNDGLLPPQSPSRLARVLGDYELAHGEDCLHLNIATPKVDGARRPVLVWLYGGAFVTGGNAIPWYDGSGFARNHDIVFVGVNYRLGALGFLRADGVSDGNLGIQDQALALEWVRDNIEAFGGDPNNVTLMGQSAGAISALSLLAREQSHQLFTRAILQSGRLSSLVDPQTAREAGNSMVAAAGTSPSEFRRLALDDLLKLQVQQIKAGAAFATTTTPFRPCADGDFIPSNTLDAAVNNSASKQLMIGWTRDEMSAFFAGNSQLADASPEQVQTALEREWGENWRTGEQFAKAREPGARTDRVLDLAINECMFAGSTITFAERMMQPHRLVISLRLGSTRHSFGACHCIELPFVFANARQWRPPMLEGADSIRSTH